MISFRANPNPVVNQNETKYFSLISIIMKPIFSMLSQTFSESNGDYINFIKYKYKFPTKDQLLFILSIYEDLILPYENYIMNHLKKWLWGKIYNG